MKCFFAHFLICLVVIASGKAVYAEVSCSSGKHWVSAHFRRAYKRHNGTFVKASNVKAYCRQNPKGYEKWHQSTSNARPKVWGYKKEKSKKWKVEELQRFYDAISVVPDKLINLKNIKIYRMARSIFKGNPATSNFGEITLYDEAFTYRDSLAQIITHELSHALYEKLNYKETESFRLSAGWVEDLLIEGALTTVKDKKFIQPDSKISISEDFANHIEYYLFKNKLLEKESPTAFQWIKGKYGPEFKINRGISK